MLEGISVIGLGNLRVLMRPQGLGRGWISDPSKYCCTDNLEHMLYVNPLLYLDILHCIAYKELFIGSSLWIKRRSVLQWLWRLVLWLLWEDTI